jgi:hypothetical protein
MSNARYIDGLGRIVNFIYDPVVTDADSPFAVAAPKLLATWGPGTRRQSF